MKTKTQAQADMLSRLYATYKGDHTLLNEIATEHTAVLRLILTNKLGVYQ